jgi:transposase
MSASLNAYRKLFPTRIQYLPISGAKYDMETQKNIVCGAVAIESTGVYWIPIYTVLEGSIEVTLANAYKVKHTPGKKTDKRDSKWLAELCLNGMIESSRIFPKDDRDIRSLTRAREKLVNNSTQMKNRIHKELESTCIKISSVLSDIFGVSGMKIINGLLEGKNIDVILKMITSKAILKKEQELRHAVTSSLDPARILLIRTYLDLIEKIESEKILFAYSGKEREEKSYRGIGTKSSLYIASSPGE